MKLKNFKSKFGFTLVELIVVITILAILSTIAFISFQGYTKNSRDSNRLTTLKNIKNGLDNFLTIKSKLPEPDNFIDISYSGSSISYQGYLSNNSASLIGFSIPPSDPLDKSKYTYGVSSDYKKFQILTLLENPNSIAFQNIIPKTYAADYSSRTPKTLGDGIGIILGTGSNLNKPIQENYNSSTFTGIDLATNTGYLAIINNSKSISGNNLLVLKNTAFNGYDSSLIGYWDMETIYMSGAVPYIKDLSGNGVDCQGNIANILTGGLKGKALTLPTSLGNIRCSASGEVDKIIGKKPFSLILSYRLDDLNNIGIFTIGGGIGMNQVTYYQTGGIKYGKITATQTQISVSSNLNTTEFNISALSFDGNYLKFYENGEYVGQYDYTNGGNGSSYILLFPGGVPINTIQNGSITLDEAKLYSRALSENEIKNVTNSMR